MKVPKEEEKEKKEKVQSEGSDDKKGFDVDGMLGALEEKGIDVAGFLDKLGEMDEETAARHRWESQTTAQLTAIEHKVGVLAETFKNMLAGVNALLPKGGPK